jgi:hypothetical protein
MVAKYRIYTIERKKGIEDDMWRYVIHYELLVSFFVGDKQSGHLLWGTGETRGYNAASIKHHAIFSKLFGTILSHVHTGEPHASETIYLFWYPNFITSTVTMHQINQAAWCGYKPVVFCVAHLDQGREIRNPNKGRLFLSCVWIIWSERTLNLNLYIWDVMRCSAEVKSPDSSVVWVWPQDSTCLSPLWATLYCIFKIRKIILAWYTRQCPV